MRAHAQLYRAETAKLVRQQKPQDARPSVLPRTTRNNTTLSRNIAVKLHVDGIFPSLPRSPN
jgi:hypothetical protein